MLDKEHEQHPPPNKLQEFKTGGQAPPSIITFNAAQHVVNDGAVLIVGDVAAGVVDVVVVVVVVVGLNDNEHWLEVDVKALPSLSLYIT